MEILNTVFTFVSNNILTKAEFFVGLIVLVGYILLGRKWYETLAGFLKAVVGYMILNVGSAGLINTFRPILAGLNQKFHLNAVVIDPYFGLNAVNAALENIGLSAAWTMTSLLLAFIWNIILLIFRKFTKLRTLLLTGHIMVQQATTVTWIVFLFIPGLRNIWGAVAVGILVGTYQAVFSNLTVEPTEANCPPVIAFPITNRIIIRMIQRIRLEFFLTNDFEPFSAAILFILFALL